MVYSVDGDGVGTKIRKIISSLSHDGSKQLVVFQCSVSDGDTHLVLPSLKGTKILEKFDYSSIFLDFCRLYPDMVHFNDTQMRRGTPVHQL